MAQVCLLSVLRLVFLVFWYLIVQLLICFALEVSQNIRNSFIIVLVNNEHVFVFLFNIFLQVIMIFRFIRLFFILLLFFVVQLLFCFALEVPTLSENIRNFFLQVIMISGL